MSGDHGNADALRRNEKFLQAIFGPDWQRAHVCAVAGDPSLKGGNWSGGPAEWAASLGLGDKTNNYFCVSLFQGTRRRINEFKRLMCLAVDDVGPKLDPDLVELLLGPPTWIVETSRDNFQWGYKLDAPITDAAVAGGLIKRVRVALTGEDGKDPGMEAVTRYVRLPTGLNLKASLGQPWRVLLKKFDLSIGLKANTIEMISGTPTAVGQGDKELFDDLMRPGGSEDPILRPAYANKINNYRGNINADDPVLKSLRKLGLVLGPPRNTAMGWGFDIRCPWIDEHTDRAETGTVYVAGAGKFKCQHGHCADRTVEDVRGKLDELLRDAGHTGGLIHEEFDVIDPKAVPAPPQGLRAKPGTSETSFFDRYVVMKGRNRFFGLADDHEVLAPEIDTLWAAVLRPVLPTTGSGKTQKVITPSQWLMRDKRCRRVNGFVGWPGMPRIVVPDPAEPTRLYINTWEPMKRPLGQVAAGEVDERAIMPWLTIFWHFIGTDTIAQWEIGEMLLDWMALALGDPSLKPGWHVILMGQQGVGKDTMILPVVSTLGPEWAQTLDTQQIGHNFNEWEAKRLIQFTETNQNTRGSLTAHDVMTLLKALFDNTRAWVAINPKYRDKYKSRNVVMGWFTSNEREPLRLQPGDRRFLVLDRNETKPLSPKIYADLHDWFTSSTTASSVSGARSMTGIERVAEFLYRRWDQMSDARRKALTGTAPMTPDKQALLGRLKHPVADWIERCIAMGPSDPLTFPDIVTAGYVHSRLFTAIRTGGEGIPGGVGLPGLPHIALYLKEVGAVRLNDGKQIKVNGSPVVLWAVRNFSAYKLLSPINLAKLFTSQLGGTSPGTIN